MRLLSQVLFAILCGLKLVYDGIVRVLWWHVVGWLFGAFAEQEFFHLADDEFFGFRVHRVQTVFVDQHGLVVDPLVPGGL